MFRQPAGRAHVSHVQSRLTELSQLTSCLPALETGSAAPWAGGRLLLQLVVVHVDEPLHLLVSDLLVLQQGALLAPAGDVWGNWVLPRIIGFLEVYEL